MIATGMPGCMPQSEHEAIAAEPRSFTGQYPVHMTLRSMLLAFLWTPFVNCMICLSATPKRWEHELRKKAVME